MIKEKIILDLAKGKDVLDIGSIGQSSKYSLWNLLLDAGAKSLVGIDLPDAEDTARKDFSVVETAIPRAGNIVFGNMETYQFARQFDLIVAGDVLEHVDNQGLFLANIKKHLKSDGLFVVSTPNAKWFTAILKPNPTHALWHDKYTLTAVLKRVGFEVQSFRYYFGNKPYYNPLYRLLCWRQGMLAICRHQTADRP
jgi:2-polyprenyl-3-methyl-5-hydroxy-6-metoxy-1,4-benzoquinol methylase